MIIVEGTPGSGKSARLGLKCQDGRSIVFPEAQPPRGGGTPESIEDRLLAEDLDRSAMARLVAGSMPEFEVFSDRCYVGILAYRYAMWKFGRITRLAFKRAVDKCGSLGVMESHDLDLVRIYVTSPELSLQRRNSLVDGRYHGEWFDLRFLNYYNEFLTDRREYLPANCEIISGDGDDSALRLTSHARGPRIACSHCAPSELRSPILQGIGSSWQHSARAVHVQFGEKSLCLNSARAIAETVWGMAPNSDLGRRAQADSIGSFA